MVATIGVKGPRIIPTTPAIAAPAIARGTSGLTRMFAGRATSEKRPML